MSSLIASIGVVRRDEDAKEVSPRVQHGRLVQLRRNAASRGFTSLPGIGSWEGINESVAILSAGVFTEPAAFLLNNIKGAAPFGDKIPEQLANYRSATTLFVEHVVRLACNYGQAAVWIGATDKLTTGRITKGLVICCDTGEVLQETTGEYNNRERATAEGTVSLYKQLEKNYTLVLKDDLSAPLFSIIDITA